MTAVASPHFVAVPPAGVASSRLIGRIARAIVARGWSLDSLSVSRQWRFRVGRARWIARAYVSLFFHGWHVSTMRPRGGSVFAIYFEGKGSAEDLERSALVQGLRGRLGLASPGKGFTWKLPNESRPSRILGELDRVAAAFGTGDRHRVPPSRSRTPTHRLVAIADAVLAHGTWSFEGPSLWLWRDHVQASISAMRTSYRDRAEIASMLMIDHGGAPARTTTTTSKMLPLSLRDALAEARLLEAAVAEARKPPRAR